MADLGSDFIWLVSAFKISSALGLIYVCSVTAKGLRRVCLSHCYVKQTRLFSNRLWASLL